MRRPLYPFPDGVVPEPADHLGLWFDKFCHVWSESWGLKAERGDDQQSPKLRWIHTVAGRKAGTDAEIRAYAQRIEQLVSARNGRMVAVTARSRFVTGLGRSHPTENGFAWHPTLGTPYLPGSSLKGLVRAWARSQSDPRWPNILGDEHCSGTVALLDAVPLSPVKLEADVMTPHYAGWTDDEPPGDWNSPNPIPFLVTAAGLRLLCGIVPLRPEAAEHLATVETWLKEALDTLGAGAKTAVGYGHFGPDLTAQREVEGWRQDREKQTPEGRWRSAVLSATEQVVIDMVREKLPELTDPRERRAFVAAVLERGWVQKWARGEKNDSRTNSGAKLLKKHAHAIMAAADALGLTW